MPKLPVPVLLGTVMYVYMDEDGKDLTPDKDLLLLPRPGDDSWRWRIKLLSHVTHQKVPT